MLQVDDAIIDTSGTVWEEISGVTIQGGWPKNIPLVSAGDYIYLVGGTYGGPWVNDIYAYNVNDNTFGYLMDMNEPCIITIRHWQWW